MPAEGEVKRECAACGRLIDAEVLICPYCDDDLALKLQLARMHAPSERRTSAHESDAPQLNDAQVSNAINIRRITIVIILAVVVTVGTTLVDMINLVFVEDSSDSLALLKTWVGFAVLIMVIGVLVIVFNKRLTRPGGPAFLGPD